jgi:hypothetical protein
MFYIYRITNNINGKTYIGQRKCPKNKTPETDKYMGSGKRLHLAYKKYGIENFTKTIINKNIQTRPVINMLELYYIKKELETRGKDCYNILIGAHWEKSNIPWNKGKHTGLTPANKGTHFTFDRGSEEYKSRYLNRSYDHEKLSAAHKGQVAWNKGCKLSEEQCKRISEYNKLNGIKPPLQKGKKWFNNGIKSVLSFECPEGYVAGRIKWAKEN